MKKLLYYLLSAAGVVFLFGAFEGAPTPQPSPSALSAAGSISKPVSVVTGTCTRDKTSNPAEKSSECKSTAIGDACSRALMATATEKSTALNRSIVTIKGNYTPDSCIDCHDDEVAAFYRTTHSKSWQGGMGCEQCHGDPTKHMETRGGEGTITSMETLSPTQQSATCLKCHEKTGEQSHFEISEHQRAGVACVTCHEVHPSADQKLKMNTVGKSAMMRGTQMELCTSCHTQVAAEFDKPTHHRVPEGTLQCTSCHNPHGTSQDHQLRADTKTLCVSCHQDKRGPFVYEHNAMELDGCLSCHEQHGSSARNMLKDRDPRELCISCHSREAGQGLGIPHGRGQESLQAMGDCTRCHNDIHGSNKDQYFIQ